MFSLIILGIMKEDCDIKTGEMVSFLPLKNTSVTIAIKLFY